MITREDATALVRQLQNCFNDREFDRAAPLHTPRFFSHPLGVAGFSTGAWQLLTARFPHIRVVARDVLVDGDKAAVRSIVEGVGAPSPELYEIFRFEDGCFAEMWGASAGFPSAAGPEELVS